MGVNNLPRVVTQLRPGRGSYPRPLDRKYDAVPLRCVPPKEVNMYSMLERA